MYYAQEKQQHGESRDNTKIAVIFKKIVTQIILFHANIWLDSNLMKV